MSIGNETAEQEFRARMSIEGWLSQWLAEKVWEHYGTLRLGGEAFEVSGADDVPGYDEDDVLIRRKSDGKVFEVEIEVTAHVGRTAATTGGKR